jgi:hypothetical protein
LLQEGRIQEGMYGEWRKVVPVEDFYDVLLDAHVSIQNHGGYKSLMKAVCIKQFRIKNNNKQTNKKQARK